MNLGIARPVSVPALSKPQVSPCWATPPPQTLGPARAVGAQSPAFGCWAVWPLRVATPPSHEWQSLLEIPWQPSWLRGGEMVAGVPESCSENFTLNAAGAPPDLWTGRHTCTEQP